MSVNIESLIIQLARVGNTCLDLQSQDREKIEAQVKEIVKAEVAEITKVSVEAQQELEKLYQRLAAATPATPPVVEPAPIEVPVDEFPTPPVVPPVVEPVPAEVPTAPTVPVVRPTPVPVVRPTPAGEAPTTPAVPPATRPVPPPFNL